MYIYIYIYINIYIYICIYTYMYTHIHTHTCISIHTYIYVYIYIYMYTSIRFVCAHGYLKDLPGNCHMSIAADMPHRCPCIDPRWSPSVARSNSSMWIWVICFRVCVPMCMCHIYSHTHRAWPWFKLNCKKGLFFATTHSNCVTLVIFRKLQNNVHTYINHT